MKASFTLPLREALGEQAGEVEASSPRFYPNVEMMLAIIFPSTPFSNYIQKRGKDAIMC